MPITSLLIYLNKPANSNKKAKIDIFKWKEKKQQNDFSWVKQPVLESDNTVKKIKKFQRGLKQF